MVKKKRKHGGHYCKVCGCHKSNESFSGRGHALHICKECQSLPKDEQADMMRCNEVERAAFRFPHEAAGLGTAGKICQEVQGQGVGKIRAGDAGHGNGAFLCRKRTMKKRMNGTTTFFR